MNQKFIPVTEKVLCFACEEIFAKNEVTVINNCNLCDNCYANYQEEFDE